MNVPLCPSAADKLKKMSGKLSKDLVNKIVSECKVDYVPRPDIKYIIQPDFVLLKQNIDILTFVDRDSYYSNRL